ncbi:siderophore-interacting protein [Methylophilus sp. Q8]|uniref:siderophore-interacting protein n=1 Tax=Methylophilus sp. Q8 TaxID=1506586 RepID=UPI000648CEDF|nr:siderophore-interacting protein [Methylophilus sp. Q8]
MFIKEHQFERVRFELQQRPVEVLKVDHTSEGFVTVTFTGPLLAQFNSLSFDDHIKFIFTNSQGETVRRDYTPRSFDTASRELAIEFALHAHGDASDWARNAKPGDQAIIAGPKSSRIIPKGFDWHLLIADSSSLPAVARRLEELPLEADVIALIQIEQENDRREFDRSTARVIRWGDSHQSLIDMIKEMSLPEGEGFSWVAGEHTFVLQVRDVLLEQGQPKELMKAAAYWKKGETNFHEKI